MILISTDPHISLKSSPTDVYPFRTTAIHDHVAVGSYQDIQAPEPDVTIEQGIWGTEYQLMYRCMERVRGLLWRCRAVVLIVYQ